MRHKILIILTAAMAAIGCSKSDTPQPSVPTVDPNIIAFSGAEQTRGLIYSNSNGNLKQMDVYAYYTEHSSWAGATKADIVDFMTHQLVEKNAAGDWEYNPIKYWSNDTQDNFSFFAFTPYDRVERVVDATTGKPSFEYAMSPHSDENNDLLVAAEYDRQKAEGQVVFNYKHSLTRVSLIGKLTEEINTAEYEKLGETNVRFVISGITFTNISPKGTLTFDNSEDYEWAVDTAEPKMDYVASQGTTLRAYDDINAPLSTTAKDVCMDNNAIFFLPQSVEGATLHIRICKIFDKTDIDGNVTKDCELIYATEDVAVPTPSSSNGKFEKEQWINMNFEFNPNDMDELNTPMTVSSVIHPWNDIDLDIDIHKNVYMYTSDLDTEYTLEGGVEFSIYTNYYHDIRVPNKRTELDGVTVTTARGILFHSAAFANDGLEKCYVPEFVSESGNTMKFVVKVGGQDPKPGYENYEFNFEVERTTRGALGLSTTTDNSSEVNKKAEDPVYILTFTNDAGHEAISPGATFSGIIGVEMLSDGGGMLEMRYKVTATPPAE